MARSGSKGQIKTHNKGTPKGGHRLSSNARVPRQHRGRMSKRG